MSRSIAEINNFLQEQMKKLNVNRVPVSVAAKWLHDRGFLRDSKTSPGFPLRRLIKQNKIFGAKKINNFFWYIHRVPNYRELISAKELQKILGMKNLNSVYKKVKMKSIPCFRLNDKSIVFYKDEVVNWLVQHNHQEKLSLLNQNTGETFLEEKSG